MEGLELTCFQIIAASGAAKSAFIAAIEAAKNRDYDQAAELIAEGEANMNQGHAPHAELIQKEAAGESTPASLLLIHAEDQMMGAEQFKVLAEQMIDLYHELDEMKK